MPGLAAGPVVPTEGDTGVMQTGRVGMGKVAYPVGSFGDKSVSGNCDTEPATCRETLLTTKSRRFLE